MNDWHCRACGAHHTGLVSECEHAPPASRAEQHAKAVAVVARFLRERAERQKGQP